MWGSAWPCAGARIERVGIILELRISLKRVATWPAGIVKMVDGLRDSTHLQLGLRSKTRQSAASQSYLSLCLVEHSARRYILVSLSTRAANPRNTSRIKPNSTSSPPYKAAKNNSHSPPTTPPSAPGSMPTDPQICKKTRTPLLRPYIAAPPD